jgi:hypothetical protein
LANTFKTSMQHRGALDKKIAEKVGAVDDPVLLKLVKDYRGKLLYDDDSDGHYIVTEVNLVEWAKHQYWSATSAPVEKKSGHWVVCASAIAGGEPGACVYHHSSLQAFTLANVTDPEAPIFYDAVDDMIASHESLESRNNSTSNGKRKRS